LHWTGKVESLVIVDPSLNIKNGSAVRTEDTKLTNETKESSAIKYKKGH
jgi:hypothetical protein